MAPSRKRKHTVAADQPASKQTFPTSTQTSIKAFANVSKDHVAEHGEKKRKTVHIREPTRPVITLTKSTPSRGDKKRKRNLDAVEEESEEEAPHARTKIQDGFFKQFATTLDSETPRNKRIKNGLPPSPAETPSKKAAALFDTLKLDAASAAPIPFDLSKRKPAYDTPPDTPTSSKQDSTDKTAPLFARGRQRLADLKSHAAAAATATAIAEKSATDIPAAQKSTSAVQSRGTTLLDRVLAKQSLTASLPAGPTRQQLERKAALHRVEDVARVLELLAAAKPRCSFSMAGLVQLLQQSLRNPISREEVERCLDVMAGEITPGFVTVFTTGSVRGVVISKGLKVGLGELRERVRRALG